MLDQAVLAAMNKFDRVLNRYDMILTLQIGIIDHRRQRGRFAGAGWPGHQNQAFFEHGKFFQHRRQTKLVHRHYI